MAIYKIIKIDTSQVYLSKNGEDLLSIKKENFDFPIIVGQQVDVYRDNQGRFLIQPKIKTSQSTKAIKGAFLLIVLLIVKTIIIPSFYKTTNQNTKSSFSPVTMNKSILDSSEHSTSSSIGRATKNSSTISESSHLPSGQSTSQEVALSSDTMDLDAIVAGDFSSVIGRWRGNKSQESMIETPTGIISRGGVLPIDDKGVVGRDGIIDLHKTSEGVKGKAIRLSISGDDAYITFVPKGTVIERFKGIVDNSQDYIIYEFEAQEDEENPVKEEFIFYRE